MDGETAMAFAGHRFQQLHPRETCPDWLLRCTTISYFWDSDDNYIVSFSVAPKATNDGVSYFTASVDPLSGEIKVLLDSGWSQFSGDEFQGYDQNSEETP